MQTSLFGNTEIKTKEHEKPRYDGFVRKPAAPFGETDKKGNYWYQRFFEEIKKFPETERTVLIEMILNWPYDRIDSARKILDRYCNSETLEKDNFHEAMGR